jgi:Circularly permutated YpsA SLOG family
LPGAGYRQRTQQNVIDSDGTAILFYESLSGGTKLTRDLCVREKKPFVVLDAKRISESAAAAAIVRFVDENEIQVLNVAGPRASGWVAGYRFALDVVSGVIRDVGSIDLAAVRTP